MEILKYFNNHFIFKGTGFKFTGHKGNLLNLISKICKQKR